MQAVKVKMTYFATGKQQAHNTSETPTEDLMFNV